MGIFGKDVFINVFIGDEFYLSVSIIVGVLSSYLFFVFFCGLVIYFLWLGKFSLFCIGVEGIVDLVFDSYVLMEIGLVVIGVVLDIWIWYCYY